MKTSALILLILTLTSFCQNNPQMSVERKEMTVIISEVAKSNFNALELERITKINKKHFTSAIYFKKENQKEKSSYAINDKVFNWEYFNKNIAQTLRNGKEINAKLYVSVYNDKDKTTIVDSIKTLN
jgi:hypothetical protein